MNSKTVNIVRLGWAAVLLVAGVGTTALIGIRRVVSADREAAMTATVVDTLNALLSELKDAETGQRGYIITGDSTYLDPLRRAAHDLPAGIDAARRMTSGSPDQSRDLAVLVALIDRRMAEIDTTVRLRSSAGLAIAANVVRSNSGKRSMDSIRVVVGRMNGRARDALVSTARDAEATAVFGSGLIIAGTLVALGLALASQAAIARTARRLSRISDSLAAANDRLSESNVALTMQTAEAEAARTEAELARADALAASQAKVDFLAVMSHELRTPLNAILGFASLVGDEASGSLNERHVGYLKRAREAGERLLRMIDEILLFTKGGTDFSEGAAESCNLIDVVLDIVRETEPRARDKGVDLWFDPPQTTVLVVGNRARVRRVIGHLVDNALKFTESGEVRIEVTVAPTRVRLAVIDTGIGIPSGQLHRIFEPFSQVDQARNRRADGAGLGLAVARRTARILGGDIEVNATSERGSTFSVSLLRHREASDALASVSAMPEAVQRRQD